MRFSFDPGLTEAVVWREIERREQEGDLSLFATYHEYADRIYEFRRAEERQPEFEKLHEKFFRMLGFADAIEGAFEEFPELKSKVREVFVGSALSRSEEGADLSRDLQIIGIKIRVERFEDLGTLKGFLRRELLHACDMLDEQFGYLPPEVLSSMPGAEQNLVRERFRLLWDIYVDSRLVRRGRGSADWRELRLAEFAAFYRKLPEHLRSRIFDSLWQAERLTHAELLEMARDLNKLVGRYERHALDLSGEERASMPGAPCPLCRFPTYAWSNELTVEIIKLIKQDSPAWEPEQGACERCVELYSLKACSW